MKWAKGFTFELEEHHYAEDEFFFPEMRARIPAVAGVLDRLDGDHKAMDVLLERWPALMRDLADAKTPFEPAKAAALQLGTELRDLIEVHLAVEDEDILPMYWRHYTAEEYDADPADRHQEGQEEGLLLHRPLVGRVRSRARSARRSSPRSPARCGSSTAW